MKKIYFTEEEKEAAKKEYQRQWRETHPDYNKKWSKTPYGRAHYLLKMYRRADKDKGRGKCTLTAQWIVDNIFTQKCAHCEKTGWEIIGCNRIDNSLPHTPDNVEPCCQECNSKLAANNRERDELGRWKDKTPLTK